VDESYPKMKKALIFIAGKHPITKEATAYWYRNVKPLNESLDEKHVH
jgi:hypothetical protein